MYNFDEIIDRSKTISVKQGFRKEHGLDDDVIALWVADMDFRSPKECCESVVKAGELGIFGYAGEKDAYFEALQGWMKKRHRWDIKKEWVIRTPGVVSALAFAVRALTKEGEGVMIMRPVYPPFTAVVTGLDRKLVLHELKLDENTRFQIDFDEMERQMKEEEVKAFILCSPHNPGGRIWSSEELDKIADLCLKYGVYLITDEIHHDFILPGRSFTPVGTIEKIMDQAVICTAPSKTFNIAGLDISNIMIPNEEIRARFQKELNAVHVGANNLIGMECCRLCYENGEQWLDELLVYLNDNVSIVREAVSKIPGARMMEPEGTYLPWVDLNAVMEKMGLDENAFQQKLQHEAKVWLNPGSMFGEEGTGWFRVNIGCPHATLVEAMNRILAFCK